MKTKKSILLILVMFFSGSVFSQVTLPVNGDQDKFVKLIANCDKAVFLIEARDTSTNVLISQGTGFFIDSTGLGLTNYHVMEDFNKYNFKAKTTDGKLYDIDELISYDEDADVLMFHVSNPGKTNFTYLHTDNDSTLKGSMIMVIGNPEGFTNTVSLGIISAIRDKQYGRDLQITAPISHGSSGSPVINMDGKVIGVVKAAYTEGQNLNFCISINVLNRIAKKEFQATERKSFTRNYDAGILAYYDYDYKRALEYFNIALKSNPTSANAFFYRGVAKDQLSIPSAIDDLKKAVQLGNNNAQSYIDSYLTKK